jgi:glycosyltransferase involved in cell wall biosynthesis
MISVTMLTKNSERYLERILEALSPFDEVIVLDTGSEDATLAIAAKFKNVKIHRHPFIGFGASHNLASSFAKHDWILSIDSDEIPSKEFVEEVEALSLDPECIYSLERHNFYRGKFIKGCGWYPDRVARLYNRRKTQFSEDFVHEVILAKGFRIVPIKTPVTHFPYRSVDDFLNKMQHYSTLFAKQYEQRKPSSLPRAILHGSFAFLKSYLFKRGFLYGSQGFEISVYNAITAYYKYLKLRDINSR